jgi:hypothetical protein
MEFAHDDANRPVGSESRDQRCFGPLPIRHLLVEEKALVVLVVAARHIVAFLESKPPWGDVNTCRWAVVVAAEDLVVNIEPDTHVVVPPTVAVDRDAAMVVEVKKEAIAKAAVEVGEESAAVDLVVDDEVHA